MIKLVNRLVYIIGVVIFISIVIALCVTYQSFETEYHYDSIVYTE